MSYNKKVYRRYSSTRNGGKSATNLVSSGSELIYWAMFVVLAFVCYWVYKKLFSAGVGSAAVNAVDKEVIAHSSDRMINGNTYMQGAKYLYDHLLGGSFLGMLKDVDEDAVGRYLLTVKRQEYQQLEATFKVYKDEKNWGFSRVMTLTDLLKWCFNSSEQSKYLTHLLG